MTKDEPQQQKTSVTQFRPLMLLLPTITLYFIANSWQSHSGRFFPLWIQLIIKALPILVLIYFVLRRHNRSLTSVWYCTFTRFIFFGLIFSLMGDSLLVYQNVSDIYFMSGVVTFGIGHALYMCAFGFTPFAPYTLWKFTVAVFAYYWHLWDGGLKNETTLIQAGVAVYALLNGAMNWRCWGRLSVSDFVQGRWFEFFGCIGAINFLFSDAVLAVNKFSTPVPYADYIIMGTYYIAQLGIALSIVDGPDIYREEKKKKQE